MTEPTSNTTSPVVKLLLVALSLLVGVAAAEGVNRVRLNSAGRPYDATAVREELQREFESRDQLGGDAQEEGKEELRALHPYTAFDLLPALRQISADVDYYKTPESEETFEILILGGSVANGFGRDASATLIELLQADPRFAGRPMRTLRYARPSFKQPQQLNSLNYLLGLGLRPDAVINLDGFNEVAVANLNTKFGAHPMQPAVAQWSPHVVGLLEDEAALEGLLDLRILRLEIDALAGRALDSGWLWSSFAGNWWLDRVRAGRQRQDRLQAELLNRLAGGEDNPVIRGPRWDGDLQAVMDLSVANWKLASISMDAICERQSIFYLHVLQPTLHAAVSKVATPRELERGKAPPEWMDAVRVGYPMLIEAGAELRASGVAFLDATPVFQEQAGSVYIDACHFNVPGQRRLAEWIAAAFLAGYGGR